MLIVRKVLWCVLRVANRIRILIADCSPTAAGHFTYADGFHSPPPSPCTVALEAGGSYHSRAGYHQTDEYSRNEHVLEVLSFARR